MLQMVKFARCLPVTPGRGHHLKQSSYMQHVSEDDARLIKHIHINDHEKNQGHKQKETAKDTCRAQLHLMAHR